MLSRSEPPRRAGPLGPQHKREWGGLAGGSDSHRLGQFCYRTLDPVLLSLCDVTLGLFSFHPELRLPRPLWPWGAWSQQGRGSLVALISPGGAGGPAMPLRNDAIPLVKEPRPPPQAPLPWILPSLFAAFNVVLLLVFSGLFFAFP